MVFVVVVVAVTLRRHIIIKLLCVKDASVEGSLRVPNFCEYWKKKKKLFLFRSFLLNQQRTVRRGGVDNANFVIISTVRISVTIAVCYFLNGRTFTFSSPTALKYYPLNTRLVWRFGQPTVANNHPHCRLLFND